VDLLHVIALLGAAVVFVPIFKRIGLGSVLGYLAGGLVIGPFGLKLFREPEAIVSFAEIGVVLLLFVIGLEMKPSRLWALRKEIFGLGVSQVVFCGLLLTGAAVLLGFPPAVAFIAAMGFVMTSTAIVLQLLTERGETNSTSGQKIVSILLLEDLAIVPLLAAIAFLSPFPSEMTSQPRWLEIVIALAAIIGVIAVARYLLNPIFRIFAAARAREIMTAAALLVVLGSAVVMDFAGLSMATGAFVAGVILSESSFRNELEADIEPFRGLLLGLFFLGVGMSLDLFVVGRDWMLITAIVATFMIVKAAGIYAVARVFGSDNDEAFRRLALMAQGGEFAFVLYAAAVNMRVFSADTSALFTAAVIISMVLTPFLVIAVRRLLPKPVQSFDGVERVPDGQTGTVLIIGFGRFGQVVSQHLLARGIDVTIIDTDTDMIRSAGRFGFKIYYGDGTRLDVLRAAGAGTAQVIAICTDDRESTDKIVELVKSEFPLAALNVRSFDRGHTLDLIKAGVDYQIREVFESAMTFGEATLRALGVEPEDARAIAEEVRERDQERLELQMTGGLLAGGDTLRTRPVPTPLVPPKRAPRPLSEETAVVAEKEDAPPAE